jgi:two-component system, NtrC family, sensor kinase
LALIKEKGSVKDFEVQQKRKDGSVFWASFTSIPQNTALNEQQIVNVIQDITERKAAEEALHQSEERFRNLVENLPVGIVITEMNGRILMVNKAYVEMRGYGSEQEIVQIPVTERYYDPNDRERFLNLIRNGSVKNFEVRQKCKDGSYFWVSSSSIPYTAPSGEQQFINVQEDITERKKAEETLLKSEAKYRNLVENAPVGIAIITPEGRLLEVNRTRREMAGYDSKEEYLNVDVSQRHHDSRERERWLKLVREKGRVTNYEMRLRHKDGTPYWGSVSTMPQISDSGEQQFITVTQDITDRKKAEEALRQSEEKLRLMFNSLSQGVSVSNLEGKITDVNDVKVRMHGYGSKEDIIGRNVSEFASPRDRDRSAQNRKRLLEGNLIKNFEYTYITRDGKEFPAEVSSAIFKDSQGNPLGTITISEDITERKKMDQQLMLTDRLASIGQLSAGIAHEINNPLTGVIGFSELLLEKDLPADIKADVETINREAKRTAVIVKGLLTFSRKQGTDKSPVDINTVIRWVLQMRSYEQRVNNIEAVDCLASDLPQIMGNGAQMQQVFINLIVNAEQAMTEAHGKGKLTITTTQAGDKVRVSVSDDGPGISPESMRKLFTPFFTTKEVGKGTGLGLSICHGIVTEHGGRIYAESEPGKGATFIIELPAAIVDKGL